MNHLLYKSKNFICVSRETAIDALFREPLDPFEAPTANVSVKPKRPSVINDVPLNLSIDRKESLIRPKDESHGEMDDMKNMIQAMSQKMNQL